MDARAGVRKDAAIKVPHFRNPRHFPRSEVRFLHCSTDIDTWPPCKALPTKPSADVVSEDPLSRPRSYLANTDCSSRTQPHHTLKPHPPPDHSPWKTRGPGLPNHCLVARRPRRLTPRSRRSHCSSGITGRLTPAPWPRRTRRSDSTRSSPTRAARPCQTSCCTLSVSPSGS